MDFVDVLVELGALGYARCICVSLVSTLLSGFLIFQSKQTLAVMALLKLLQICLSCDMLLASTVEAGDHEVGWVGSYHTPFTM
jgi:hypothetical protein